MYGVVLMVAMTGGAETPALFRNKGCSGNAAYACSGYSCSGYVASSGCSGSGRKHGRKKSKGCSGCSGYVSSCYGSYSGGCYGSYAPAASCYGGYSGGYQGGCYGSYAPSVSYAPAGCYGSPVVTQPGPVITNPAPVVPMPSDKDKGNKGSKEVEKLKKPPVGGDNDANDDASARITITVPSDARVSINGTMTTTTDTTRVFEFPGLAEGTSVTYTFQAEFVRDGQNVVVTRDIEVKAGVSLEVSLENATAVAAR